MEILGLVMGDDFHTVLPRQFQQNLPGQLCLRRRARLIHQPGLLRQLNGKADPFDPLSLWNLLDVRHRQERRTIQVNIAESVRGKVVGPLGSAANDDAGAGKNGGFRLLADVLGHVAVLVSSPDEINAVLQIVVNNPAIKILDLVAG